MNGIMQTGLLFEELVLTLSSSVNDQRMRLEASRAEILDPPHFLRIHGMRFRGEGDHGQFGIDSPIALYDMQKKTIQTSGGFQANAFGLRSSGHALQGNLEQQTFSVQGDFKMGLSNMTLSSTPGNGPVWKTSSCLSPPPFYKIDGILGESITPLSTIQEFSKDLHTFIKCWQLYALDDKESQHGKSTGLTLMSRQGGKINLDSLQMQFLGRTMILGSGVAISSSGGIRLFEEILNQVRLIRVVGHNGIQASIHRPQSGDFWIASEDFEYLEDKRTLQFKGGPLIFGRGKTVLRASERWQFVRVFDGGRIVLSPGNWDSVGEVSELSR